MFNGIDWLAYNLIFNVAMFGGNLFVQFPHRAHRIDTDAVDFKFLVVKYHSGFR